MIIGGKEQLKRKELKLGKCPYCGVANQFTVTNLIYKIVEICCKNCYYQWETVLSDDLNHDSV